MQLLSRLELMPVVTDIGEVTAVGVFLKSKVFID